MMGSTRLQSALEMERHFLVRRHSTVASRWIRGKWVYGPFLHTPLFCSVTIFSYGHVSDSLGVWLSLNANVHCLESFFYPMWNQKQERKSM